MHRAFVRTVRLRVEGWFSHANLAADADLRAEMLSRAGSAAVAAPAADSSSSNTNNSSSGSGVVSVQWIHARLNALVAEQRRAHAHRTAGHGDSGYAPPEAADAGADTNADADGSAPLSPATPPEGYLPDTCAHTGADAEAEAESSDADQQSQQQQHQQQAAANGGGVSYTSLPPLAQLPLPVPMPVLFAALRESQRLVLTGGDTLVECRAPVRDVKCTVYADGFPERTPLPALRAKFAVFGEVRSVVPCLHVKAAVPPHSGYAEMALPPGEPVTAVLVEFARKKDAFRAVAVAQAKGKGQQQQLLLQQAAAAAAAATVPDSSASTATAAAATVDPASFRGMHIMPMYAYLPMVKDKKAQAVAQAQAQAQQQQQQQQQSQARAAGVQGQGQGQWDTDSAGPASASTSAVAGAGAQGRPAAVRTAATTATGAAAGTVEGQRPRPAAAAAGAATTSYAAIAAAAPAAAAAAAATTATATSTAAAGPGSSNLSARSPCFRPSATPASAPTPAPTVMSPRLRALKANAASLAASKAPVRVARGPDESRAFMSGFGMGSPGLGTEWHAGVPYGLLLLKGPPTS
jgi:hypothetical protein